MLFAQREKTFPYLNPPEWDYFVEKAAMRIIPSPRDGKTKAKVVAAKKGLQTHKKASPLVSEN